MFGPKAILNVCIGMWLLISRCQHQLALRERGGQRGEGKGVKWKRKREEAGTTEA